MDFAVGIVAWTVCVTMLVLTVLCQRPRWSWLRALKYRDVAALLPAWTFFAPNPGTTDTRLLWRETRIDGTVSVWHEILPPRGGLLRAVWNPHKRESKIITDAGPMVLRMLAANPQNRMTVISLPYLLLLQRVSVESVTSMSVARQFIVVQTKGTDADDESFRPLVLSRWHALDPVPEPNPDTRSAPPTTTVDAEVPC